MDEIVTFLTSEMRNMGLGNYGSEDKKVNQKTESAIALAFAECMSKGYLRYDESGIFMYRDGFYERVTDKDMLRVISGVLSDLGIGGVYRVNSLKKIYNTADSDLKFISKRRFKPTKTLIAFNNCVLDLSNMEFYPHNEKFETRINLKFDYDPKAKCTRWMQFLPEVLNDSASIDILQEFLGCVFIDKQDFKIAAALFLKGEGSNGKSVVYDVIAEILGDNMSETSLNQLCSGTTSDYYCDMVNGKLLNFCPDMGAEDFSKEGKYKTITSGESLTVRPIHKSPYKAKEMPLLAANINNMPVTTDNTDAFWRRLKILSFDRKFTAEDADKELPSKLKRELSGIFNWILEGRTRFIRNKGNFTQSARMDIAISKAKTEADSVIGFLEDSGYKAKCEVGEKAEILKIHTSTLYKEYSEYCAEEGKHRKSAQNMKHSLTRAGFEQIGKFRVEGSTPKEGYKVYKITDQEYYEEVKEAKIAEQAEIDFPF